MPDLGNIIKTAGSAYLDSVVPGLGTVAGSLFGGSGRGDSREAERLAEENRLKAEEKEARSNQIYRDLAGGWNNYLGQNDRLYQATLNRYAPDARTPSGYAQTSAEIDRNLSNVLRALPTGSGLTAGVGRQSMFTGAQQKAGAFQQGRLIDEQMYTNLINADPRFKYLQGLTNIQGQEALYQERGADALTEASKLSSMQSGQLGTGEQSMLSGGLNTLFSDPANLTKLGNLFGFGGKKDNTTKKDNTPQETSVTTPPPANYGSNLNMSGNVTNSGMGSPNYNLGLGTKSFSNPSIFGLGSNPKQ